VGPQVVKDRLVGRSPWIAADAPVGLRFDGFGETDQGSGADEGVRPTPKYVVNYS